MYLTVKNSSCMLKAKTYMHNRVRMNLSNISRNLMGKFDKRTFGG